MTEDDWQRVVDEKFYVVSNDINEPFIMTRERNDIHLRKHFHVLREKGIRQPVFSKHDAPRGDATVTVKYRDGAFDFGSAVMFNFDKIVEFVEH